MNFFLANFYRHLATFCWSRCWGCRKTGHRPRQKNYGPAVTAKKLRPGSYGKKITARKLRQKNYGPAVTAKKLRRGSYGKKVLTHHRCQVPERDPIHVHDLGPVRRPRDLQHPDGRDDQETESASPDNVATSRKVTTTKKNFWTKRKIPA